MQKPCSNTHRACNCTRKDISAIVFTTISLASLLLNIERCVVTWSNKNIFDISSLSFSAGWAEMRIGAHHQYYTIVTCGLSLSLD